MASGSGFKPHQRGGGCCSNVMQKFSVHNEFEVSNPISGEVGAAAKNGTCWARPTHEFQTPSAGRWVLQPLPLRFLPQPLVSCFKPHQRGGGCCSFGAGEMTVMSRDVSNPISGEVGAAAHAV